MDWLRAYTELIGFWAAVLTTVGFVPLVLRTWRSGGEGLSWLMLASFGTGVGLWFLYGVLRASGPLMLANGLTGVQVLVLAALKISQARRKTRRRDSIARSAIWRLEREFDD
jgi:MtN3 and saliva related transmembrane protein